VDARRQLRRLARLQLEFHLVARNLINLDIGDVKIGSPQQLHHASPEGWIVEPPQSLADTHGTRPIHDDEIVGKPIPQWFELLVVELDGCRQKQRSRPRRLARSRRYGVYWSARAASGIAMENITMLRMVPIAKIRLLLPLALAPKTTLPRHSLQASVNSVSVKVRPVRAGHHAEQLLVPQ
jgi:hypothetical protein